MKNKTRHIQAAIHRNRFPNNCRKEPKTPSVAYRARAHSRIIIGEVQIKVSNSHAKINTKPPEKRNK